MAVASVVVVSFIDCRIRPWPVSSHPQGRRPRWPPTVYQDQRGSSVKSSVPAALRSKQVCMHAGGSTAVSVRESSIVRSALARDGSCGKVAWEGVAVKDSERAGILAFATQGSDHLDGQRLRYLLEPVGAEMYAFDHDRKLRSAIGLTRAVRAARPRLIVM